MFKNLFRKKNLYKFYEKKEFCKFRIFINYLDKRFLQIYSKKKPESIFISPRSWFYLISLGKFIEKKSYFYLIFTRKDLLKRISNLLFFSKVSNC